MTSSTDLRSQIRSCNARTMTNLSSQQMFPFVAGREHSIWRDEVLWLPDGSICYTALVALIHERGERPSTWKSVLKRPQRNDLSDEAFMLSELTNVCAISLEVAAFLLVSAYTVADNDEYGLLQDVIKENIEKETSIPGWPPESNSVNTRIHNMEQEMMNRTIYDVKTLLGADEEYRKLLLEQSRFAIKYASNAAKFCLNNVFGLPTHLIEEAVLQGLEELNKHIERERRAMAQAVLL